METLHVHVAVIIINDTEDIHVLSKNRQQHLKVQHSFVVYIYIYCIVLL